MKHLNVLNVFILPLSCIFAANLRCRSVKDILSVKDICYVAVFKLLFGCQYAVFIEEY